MKAFALTSALTLTCCLAIPAAAVAKGPGGGHGSGGHGGGGHSGGHASGGHSGGQTQGESADSHCGILATFFASGRPVGTYQLKYFLPFVAHFRAAANCGFS